MSAHASRRMAAGTCFPKTSLLRQAITKCMVSQLVQGVCLRRAI